jgi:hypothetical protein
LISNRKFEIREPTNEGKDDEDSAEEGEAFFPVRLVCCVVLNLTWSARNATAVTSITACIHFVIGVVGAEISTTSFPLSREL